MLLVGDFGSSYCKEEDGLAISDLFKGLYFFLYLSYSRGREEEKPWQYSYFIYSNGNAFLRDFLGWSREFSTSDREDGN